MKGLEDVEGRADAGVRRKAITARAGSIRNRSRSMERWSTSASNRVQPRCCASKILPKASPSAGEVVPLPRRRRRNCPSTGTVEALVFVPKGLPLAGTLVAISESRLDHCRNLSAFLVVGDAWQFSVRRTDLSRSSTRCCCAGDLWYEGVSRC